MRTLLVFIALATLVASVRAQSVLQLYGKTGYLGEYELSGTVSDQSSNGREYSGPLVIKHVGLCTHDGPQETTSHIRLRIDKPSQQVTAALVFEGVECTYHGVLTESHHGFMDCADQTSVPLRLWTK
jgi:hypothetical protein